MHDGPTEPDAEFKQREKPMPEGTDDEDKEAYESGGLTPEQREKRRLQKKPPIDHLKDGTATLDDGSILPLFDVGDRIVAERHISFLAGAPWLDTRVYVVREINDETGEVHCTDEEMRHYACVGFKHPFTRIKLAPKKGNPFLVPKVKKEQPVRAPGDKKRGRPKGSKNRPKEVIEAERRAKKEASGR